MRFQVPQFIEIESKIFGPLTFKQFIYLAGGAGLSFLFYAFLPFFIAVIFIAPVGAFAAALAFYKVHNRPFIKVTESAFRYFTAPKIYIWRKEKIQQPTSIDKLTLKQTERGINPQYIPKFTKSKLKELAWSLDIKHNIK
ncbi:MAG: hypothetical protein A2Z62_00450 [Candidatus Terrybacteria bacterium RIFCSPLOWO2_02_42_20]|uniref:PrgI family protein n=2 Tax=Candidatus Terryibacteriota TaxID=1817920 RepID=A0A1G2PR78_9BACT|nr:MAG: hypothetical protein A2W59_02465 [Candidatus Terrybacteria bacterium RIFCSPHIGHO2_02_41_19]OHA54224.1 MAG: hypothetical protein A2Z62_00450 [Candidatus Terrybacteria bacterium RIFCSPLOWO2_02_42_20]